MLGQARADSIPAGIEVFHKDLLRYTGMVCPLIPVQSKLFAQKDLIFSQSALKRKY